MGPILASWNMTRISIISDGWTNVANKPLVNVIVNSLKGTYFLNVNNGTSKEKGTQLITNVIINAIEIVGPSNVA